MCKKCGVNSCTGCVNTSLENTVAELQETVEKLVAATRVLTEAHPILLIQSADDVALFDGNGLGSGAYEGWGICNGATYPKSSGVGTIIAPNFIDKFVVHAGGDHALNDTGGESEVTLVIPQLPAHNHAITDSGHTHGVTDTGHTHPAHTHTNASHTHTYGDEKPSVPNTGTLLANFTGGGPDTIGDTLSYPKTSDATAVVIDSTVTPSNTTGLTVNSNAAGISVANTGNGQPHNNLPPYYAAIYVIKL